MELRIVNGNSPKLRGLLGPLADKVEIKRGDAFLEVSTEESVEVGRAVFESLITQGYTANAFPKEGTGEHERVTEFPGPDTWRVVMFGPIAGG